MAITLISWQLINQFAPKGALFFYLKIKSCIKLNENENN